MTSFSAKASAPDVQPSRRVVFVAYQDVKLLDLVGPLQVFSDANDNLDPGTPRYDVQVVSIDGGTVTTDTPVPLATSAIASLDEGPIHALIVAGGRGCDAASMDQRLLAALKKLFVRCERIGSVCSGAFVLAATGILDHRRAVTHWESCSVLARMYPSVQVEADPIYVRDGNVWTSAGVTAGIDLALAMVAEDLGRASALTLARRLVAYMVRPGGQSQFSEMLQLQSTGTDGRFTALIEWISTNLDGDLRVETLAEKVGMSARNFARVFTAETGKTPAKAVEAMRIEAARLMLEETELPIREVSIRCGFSDDERMRRAFARTVHTSPNDYRQRFRKVAV